MSDDVPCRGSAGCLRNEPHAGTGVVVHAPRAVWRRPEVAEAPRPAGAERRATCRALDDWKRLREDRASPALTDLAPLHNPTDWADRFLLACDRDPPRSVFVLCGRRAEEAFGGRVIGRTLGEVAARQDALVDACGDAVHRQCPCQAEGVFRTAGKGLVLYRAVFMPVRSSDPDAQYLMGAYCCSAAA